MYVKFFAILCVLKCCDCQNDYDGSLTLIFKWNTLDYDWSDKEHRSRYINESKYISTNSFVRDFKIWAQWAYLTVPRWKIGIPATLVRIPLATTFLPASPELQPYPTWSLQMLNDCFALQSVHTIDIDSEGKLWVLDSGLVEELGENRSVCPPKLLVIDLQTNFIIKHATIPAEVRLNGSVLTTMALEREKQVVFIADSNYYESGIVVYNVTSDTFRRFSCEQLNPDEDSANINYIPAHITPEFVSISLNTDRNKLYFSTFDSQNLFYVNVSLFSRDELDISDHVVDLGKNGRTVKLIADTKGYMYFNIVNEKAVAQWRESSWVFQYTPKIILDSKLLCHWISSLDVDEDGNLWVVSNRFHDYSNNKLRVEKENIRIFRIFVPRKEKPKRPRTGFNAEYVVLILFVIIIGLIVIEILMFNTD